MKAVTAINRPFLPGLKALHRSIQRNSPNVELACMAYGDVADDVRALGIEVLDNVSVNDVLPAGEGTESGCEPMYARLLVPHLFGDAIWLDADQIVLRPLDELFRISHKHACAAVPGVPLSKEVRGLVSNADGLYSGLIAFNAKVWKEQRITERCIALMNGEQGSKITYRFVVQSYIGAVLNGQFHRLKDHWQAFANRGRLEADARVVHWHGRERKPWNRPDMPNVDLWREYA